MNRFMGVPTAPLRLKMSISYIVLSIIIFIVIISYYKSINKQSVTIVMLPTFLYV